MSTSSGLKQSPTSSDLAIYWQVDPRRHQAQAQEANKTFREGVALHKMQ